MGCGTWVRDTRPGFYNHWFLQAPRSTTGFRPSEKQTTRGLRGALNENVLNACGTLTLAMRPRLGHPPLSYGHSLLWSYALFSPIAAQDKH